jgi:hypothetical protein
MAAGNAIFAGRDETHCMHLHPFSQIPRCQIHFSNAQDTLSGADLLVGPVSQFVSHFCPDSSRQLCRRFEGDDHGTPSVNYRWRASSQAMSPISTLHDGRVRKTSKGIDHSVSVKIRERRPPFARLRLGSERDWHSPVCHNSTFITFIG